MNNFIMDYQKAIVKIYIKALQSMNRRVGREIFVSMLKGRKDSKIISSKSYFVSSVSEKEVTIFLYTVLGVNFINLMICRGWLSRNGINLRHIYIM